MPNGDDIAELRTLFENVLSATTGEITKKQEVEKTLDTILQSIAAIAEQPYEERRELYTALLELKEDVRNLRHQVTWGNRVLSGLYSQIETLIAVVASGREMDREELREMQRKMRDQIFDTQTGLKVEAAGDVRIEGDLVGKDKRTMRKDNG